VAAQGCLKDALNLRLHPPQPQWHAHCCPTLHALLASAALSI
jgi:hypothetical protein